MLRKTATDSRFQGVCKNLIKTAKYSDATCLLISELSTLQRKWSQGIFQPKIVPRFVLEFSVRSNHGEAKDEPIVRVDAKVTMQLC